MLLEALQSQQVTTSVSECECVKKRGIVGEPVLCFQRYDFQENQVCCCRKQKGNQCFDFQNTFFHSYTEEKTRRMISP